MIFLYLNFIRLQKKFPQKTKKCIGYFTSDLKINEKILFYYLAIFEPRLHR